MVEHIRKQGKFKNFLAVHDNYGNAAVALAVMISELSEEPWKGKLMNFSRNPQRHYFFSPENPQLHSLQGDLKAKLEILKDTRQWKVDLEVLFDSVLEVAVKNDLKPEQMIRRVFVFTSCEDFDKTLPAAMVVSTAGRCSMRRYRESSRTKGTAMRCHRLCFGKRTTVCLHLRLMHCMG
ncbi:unnamed protein product [Prunus armeniaca]